MDGVVEALDAIGGAFGGGGVVLGGGQHVVITPQRIGIQ